MSWLRETVRFFALYLVVGACFAVPAAIYAVFSRAMGWKQGSPSGLPIAIGFVLAYFSWTRLSTRGARPLTTLFVYRTSLIRVATAEGSRTAHADIRAPIPRRQQYFEIPQPQVGKPAPAGR